MRRVINALLCFTILWVVISGNSFAENVYVSDEFEITMRTGANTDRKIISILTSGQLLEMVERGQEWSKVRLPSGKEGWVLTRYLSSEEPSKLVLKRLTIKQKSLQTQYADVFEENSKLSKENQQLKSELKTTKENLSVTTKAYDKLREGSKEYVKIKEEHEVLTNSLEIAKKRADRFENMALKLARNDSIKWFLSGAGVFLSGVFIGMLLSSKRRKRAYLL